MQLHRKTLYAAVGAGSEAFEKTRKAVSVAIKSPDLALSVAHRVREKAEGAVKDAAKRFESYAERGEKVLARNGASNGATKTRKAPKPRTPRTSPSSEPPLVVEVTEAVEEIRAIPEI
ncbi:MAG: hypothetical protein ACYDCC_14870 [Actinomycetota bacterium]